MGRRDQPLQHLPSLPRSDTYFFKGGPLYWRFLKGSIKAEPDFSLMGPKFLDCPAPSVGPRAPRTPRGTFKPGDCDQSVRDQSGA